MPTWLDVHWIIWRWCVQKLLEIFHTSLSLSFFSDNRGPTYMGLSGLSDIPESFFSVGVNSSRVEYVAVVSCFLCDDSQTIQECSPVFFFIIWLASVYAAGALIFSERVRLLFSAAFLFLLSSILSRVSILIQIQSLLVYFFGPNTCWHEDLTASLSP